MDQITEVVETQLWDQSPWLYAFLTNAVVGFVIFEWTWAGLDRHRNPNVELDERFKMYRRNDVKNWSKPRLYLGAITVLVPRMLLAIVSFVNLLFWLNVFMIGHTEGAPLTGVRKLLL